MLLTRNSPVSLSYRPSTTVVGTVSAGAFRSGVSPLFGRIGVFNRHVVWFGVRVRAFVGVVAPGDDGIQMPRGRVDEDAQAHRGGKIAFPRGIAVRRGRVVRGAHVAAARDLLGRCLVAAMLARSRDRDQESGQVPSGGRLREEFVGEGVVVVGSDQVEP